MKQKYFTNNIVSSAVVKDRDNKYVAYFLMTIESSEKYWLFTALANAYF